MKKITVTVFLAIGCVLFNISCSKKSSTDTGSGGGSCTGVSAKFAADVQPILTTVCSINSNCHASGSINSGGPFTNHAQVAAKAAAIKTAISNMGFDADEIKANPTAYKKLDGCCKA